MHTYGSQKAMSVSFVELPSEVLEQILLFVPTPRALCRIGTTCSSLAETLATSERVWNHLYKKRWTYQVYSAETTFSQRDYRARHVQDGETLCRLLTVSDEVAHKQDYGLGRRFENPMWTQLYSEQGSFDVLRSVAINNPEIKALYQKDISLVTRSLATQLLDLVHFSNVLRQLVGLFNEIHNEASEDHLVEEAALLFAESQRKWNDLMSDKRSPSDRRCTVRESLDNLGRQLQSRIDGCGGNMSVMDTVSLLHTMLVGEMGFSISNVHDNVDKSFIDRVLISRIGFPIVLAVIFQSILRRVGVSVGIVCVPERVILGLPGGEPYVDVFSGCQRLSLGDLRALLRGHEPGWSIPLKDTEVLELLIDGFGCCYDETAQHTRSIRVRTASERIGLLTSMSDSLIDGEIFSTMRSDTTGAYLDPEIFRHFNLINDDTMRRHNEAPYFRSFQ